MTHHAGITLHYHGAGADRYGHTHGYLSIMHEHCPGCASTWHHDPRCGIAKGEAPVREETTQGPEVGGDG